MGKFPSGKLLIVAIITSFGGSFHFGYQLVITNPSQAAFIAFLNDSSIMHYGRSYDAGSAKTIWSMIIAVMFVGAMFGALSISFISQKVGRKRGLYVSISFSILSVLLAIISYHVFSYELYVVSRILLGYSIALSLGLAAMYFNESSPKQCRGFVSMMTGTMVQVGTLVGAVIAMPVLLGTSDRWWYIYLVEIIILVIVILILPFFPESPSYLTQIGDESGARKAIMFFHGCKIGAVDATIGEIKDGLKQNAKKLSLAQVFRDSYSRKGVCVGMVICFSMSFSGVVVINAFAVDILKSAGLATQEAAYVNIGLCGVSVVSSVIAMVVVDRFGRRLLLLISLAIIICLNLVVFALMLSFEIHKLAGLGFALIAIIALFLFFFAIGPGPLSFFVATEMVSQAARGVAQSCASLMTMFCRALLLAIFFPLSGAIGQSVSYIILFVAPEVLSWLYLFCSMPETKNRDIKQVIEAMEKLPSITKFFGKKKTKRRGENLQNNMQNNLRSNLPTITPGSLKPEDDDECDDSCCEENDDQKY